MAIVQSGPVKWHSTQGRALALMESLKANFPEPLVSFGWTESGMPYPLAGIDTHLQARIEGFIDGWASRECERAFTAWDKGHSAEPAGTSPDPSASP
jgi:hypothetical protein